MNKKYNYFAPSFVYVLFLFIYGVFQYHTYDLNRYINIHRVDWLVPTDGLNYINISMDVLDGFLGLDFFSLVSGFLNWATIPYLYSLVYNEFGPSNVNLIILCINCMIVFYGMYGWSVLAEEHEVNPLPFVFVCAISQMYFLGYIFVPNKDILVFALMPQLIILSERNKWVMFFLFALLSATFKIQLFIAAIAFYLSKKMKNGVFWLLLAFGMVMPIFINMGLLITSADFQDLAPETIRSAAVMNYLDSFGKYPFGALFGNFIKIILNYSAGLNPQRIFDLDPVINGIQNLTTFSLSILTVIFCVKFRGKIYSLKDIILNCGFSLIAIFFLATPPFLQSRYFWWSIPLLTIYILSKKHEKN